MSDFSVRSENVDVEQIMRQIRARIREKRGVDYTEEEIRELANVKLEKFIDPKGVRSGLLEEYRRVSGPEPLAAIALPAVPEAALQPEPADPVAAHPGGVEHAERGAPGAPRAARCAALRGDPQPRGGADEDGRRGEEPQDAAGIDGQPARFRRVPRARARRGRGVPRRRRPAAAGTHGTGSGAPGPGPSGPGTQDPGTEGPGTERPGPKEPGPKEPGPEEPGGTQKSGTAAPGTRDR